MKETEYIHRIMVVVPIADKKKANNRMVEITGRAEDADTFTVELLDTITGLPTHLVAYMSANEAEKAKLTKLKDEMPNAKWWRMDKDENEIEASDDTVKVGEKFDHKKEIEKHGLKFDHKKEIEKHGLKDDHKKEIEKHGLKDDDREKAEKP